MSFEKALVANDEMNLEPGRMQVAQRTLFWAMSDYQTAA